MSDAAAFTRVLTMRSLNEGMAIVIRMPRMTIVVSSSMMVKPGRRFGRQGAMGMALLPVVGGRLGAEVVKAQVAVGDLAPCCGGIDGVARRRAGRRSDRDGVVGVAAGRGAASPALPHQVEAGAVKRRGVGAR